TRHWASACACLSSSCGISDEMLLNHEATKNTKHRSWLERLARAVSFNPKVLGRDAQATKMHKPCLDYKHRFVLFVTSWLILFLAGATTQPATAESVQPVPLLSPEDEAKTFNLSPGFHAEVVAAEPMVQH